MKRNNNIDNENDDIRKLQERLRENEHRKDLAKEQKQDREKEEQTLARLLHDKGGLSQQDANTVAKTITDEKHKNDEKIELDNKTIDMSFIIANSLQMLYSGTDPLHEYHEWINDAIKIVHSMNDGHITPSNLEMKKDYLTNLDQRENEIKAVMSIYRGSNFEGAKKQLAFLQYKWQRLMELRNMVKSTTKNHVSQKPNKQEIQKSEAAITILPLMLKDEQARLNGEDLSWDSTNNSMLYSQRGYFVANSLPDIYGKDELLPEYKDFINSASEVIREMNDGDITLSDFNLRNEFLHSVNEKEASLLVHLSMYENRTDSIARKQSAYLKYKWEKLIEARNAVLNNTKSETEYFIDKVVSDDNKLKAITAIVVLNKLYQQESQRWKNGDYDLNNQGTFRYEYNGHFHDKPFVNQGTLLQYGIASNIHFEDGIHKPFMKEVIEKNRDMSIKERADWIMKLRGIQPNYDSKVKFVRDKYLENNNRLFTIDRYSRCVSQSM